MDKHINVSFRVAPGRGKQRWTGKSLCPMHVVCLDTSYLTTQLGLMHLFIYKTSFRDPYPVRTVQVWTEDVRQALQG